MVTSRRLNASLRVARVGVPSADDPIPYDLVLLSWRERWCPQRQFECVHGDRLVLDLPTGTTLSHGDRLFLPDGRNIEVIAAEEHLAEVCGSPLSNGRICCRWRVPYQREEGRLHRSRWLARG